MPPYKLGEPTGSDGVWTIVDAGGGPAGYVFETEPLAPLPGFSGAPINLLVTLDRDGRFLDVSIISQNEPVFVSGLGEAAFNEFVAQYRGHSINSSITVGAPYGDAEVATSTNVYLDGVLKATASVRIANETILAAALQVAREKMQGVAGAPAAHPDPDYREALSWDDLVDQRIARKLVLTNREADAAFAGSLWADDDPEAKEDMDGLYLEAYAVDIGPPSIAQAVLADSSLRELEALLTVRASDEPILIVANGRHPLVAPDYVRNTSPDRIGAEQGGFPIALRDADIEIELAADVPDFDQAMILRADRRLGFDPSTEWTLRLRAIRAHGMFMPELGTRDFAIAMETPTRFFATPDQPGPVPAWLAAIRDRAPHLAGAVLLVSMVFYAMARNMPGLAAHRLFPWVRVATLGATILFLGWSAQAQLSIVTPLAVLRTATDGGSFAFLAYDPVSALVWVGTLASVVVWGRGFFCGWLCPYGAMQELTHKAGSAVGAKTVQVPPALDLHLKKIKYGVLAALIVVTLFVPPLLDAAVEVEPFKTAVTVVFVRELGYVAYAVLWLILSVFVFKAFCRYICPLGAFLALLGRVRRFGWIERRAECGSPCQLCRVRCKYGAIDRGGRVDYAECFQCLDCVTIHQRADLCVPLVLAAKGRPLA
ncbi:MAG: 4Fe-4S binding protein [Geminicoccaceae bacterium]